MTAEENKAVVIRYLQEVWSAGNVSLVDELLAPDYSLQVLYRNPGRPQRLVNGTEGIKGSLPMYHQAFPDLKISVDLVVAEGERVVAQWTAQATHTGEFRGIKPTGKAVTYKGINIYRVVNGQIAEELYSGDRLGLWQQLGLAPESSKLVEEATRE